MTRELVTEDDSLDISLDDEDAETTFVRLKGRLNVDSSPTLRDQLLAMLRKQGQKTIIVDLTAISYIDASGIATLLEALKIARHHQGTLCLKGLQGRTARFFEVTGLSAVFKTAGCEGDTQAEVN